MVMDGGVFTITVALFPVNAEFLEQVLLSVIDTRVYVVGAVTGLETTLKGVPLITLFAV
jgi:hypothetical protein